MPRFYFHVRDGSETSQDQEGQDLPDLQAARREAVSANREMLSERLLHGGDLNHRRIEIADESGAVVDTITVSDVLFDDGHLQHYEDDVTRSAPQNIPRR